MTTVPLDTHLAALQTAVGDHDGQRAVQVIRTIGADHGTHTADRITTHLIGCGLRRLAARQGKTGGGK